MDNNIFYDKINICIGCLIILAFADRGQGTLDSRNFAYILKTYHLFSKLLT